MGIYIKGMTKPKSCDECPIRLVALPEGCEIEIGCCPIVEVAEPHGRLIDADALADDLEYDAANEQDFYKENCASWLRSNCNQTIIEAEGE